MSIQEDLLTKHLIVSNIDTFKYMQGGKMSDRYLFMMSRIQNRVVGHIKNELKLRDLVFSPGEMGVLLALENLPVNGRISMGELSLLLDMDNAALTRLVAGLEKKGLVVREINPENRRQIMAWATETGLARAKVIKGIVQEVNQRIRQGFSPEEMETYNRINQSILEKFS